MAAPTRDPFSRPLIMHPSSEYLTREEKMKQPVLSPPARLVPLESSSPDLSIILLKHAEPNTKQHLGAIPGQQCCCGSGIKPLKVIIEWFLQSSQPGPERNRSAINQIVSLYRKDEFDCTVRITDSESAAGRGVSVCVGCWENDGYVHVCLRMEGLLLAIRSGAWSIEGRSPVSLVFD